ncbi:hypothetical protein [Microbacterium alcoholitolerans]|uniref:hypothetical protein n=1 Tax=unclassified Microbacterium TaxID=2609290 RepID=UPI003D167CAD
MDTNGYAARSGALIVALALGALLLLGSAISAVPRITGYFTGYWNGHSDLLTGREPSIRISDPSDVDRVDYSGIVIVSDQTLLLPRVLQAAAEGLGILVVVGGGVLTVMLAVRMLRGRPFARMLAWGLGSVGVLAILVGAIAPQLQAWAVDAAVRELGYEVSAGFDGTLTPDSPEVIALPLWDPLWVLDRVDMTLVLLGVIIAIVGLLIADGVRMQRDTEGLV